MKEFIAPELELVRFTQVDVITTSGGTVTPGDNNYNELPLDPL